MRLEPSSAPDFFDAFASSLCHRNLVRESNKDALEALVKAMEKNRDELKKSWKKVEELDTAIQAIQAGRERLAAQKNRKSNRGA